MSSGLPGKRVLQFVLAFFAVFAPGFAQPFFQTRIVSVKIIGDEEFRRNPAWKLATKNCLGEVSADFERLFGIRFAAEDYEEWESDDSARSLDALAEDVDAHIDKETFDLLLALTAQKARSESLVGYTLFQEGIVLLKVRDDGQAMVKTLRHELGHAFGAVHVADQDSVMNCSISGEHFDDPNKTVIILNRERCFNCVGLPVPKNVRPLAVKAYEQIGRAVRMSLFQAGQASKTQPGIDGVYVEPRLAGLLGSDEPGDPFSLDDVFVLLAQLYLESREYDQALEACQTALKISPRNLETRNITGIAQRRRGMIDKAIETYAGILREKPGHPRVLYNLGIAYAKKGDLESARSAYARAIELKPNFAEAHNNLGETYLRLGRTEDAEKEFRAAASLLPGFSLAHCNLAEVFCRKKDFEGAMAEAEKALALDPESPSPPNVLGHIYYERGEIEAAVEKFRLALTIDPGYEKAYYSLGVCYLDTQGDDEAKECFLKALEINPNFAEAHAGLGYCLLREKRLDEAIADIERAIALGLTSAKAHVNLSVAYLEKGATDRAIREAEIAVQMDPRQAAAFNNLGIAYMTKGMPERAAEQFQKALEVDPNNKEALFNLGNRCFQAGKTDQALDLYLAAARIDEKNGALLNNIAVIYFQKGEYSLSWEYVQKAQALGFKIHPDFLSELKKRI